jgi:LPXTG-site transpeptidase (sortase) family protein
MSTPLTPDAPRRFRWKPLALLVAGLCLIAAVAVLVMPSPSSKATAPTTPTTSATSTAPPSISIATPTPTVPAKVIPAAAQPRRIQIPSAGIDIAVASLPDKNAENAVINPPEDPTLAYWVSQFDYGLAGEGTTDTCIIAAHSNDVDSKWPFNRLSDPTLVKVGDLIIITTDNGTLTYKVQVAAHMARGDVGSAYLERSYPDDLLLISCFTDDLKTQNRIVVAALVRN